MIDELDHPFFEELILDSRAGVQAAISKRKRELQKQVDEDLRLEKMLAYEKELYTQGIQLIAGVDEVGRGPLAGPVVAAAVILPENCKFQDSTIVKRFQNPNTRKSMRLCSKTPLRSESASRTIK